MILCVGSFLFFWFSTRRGGFCPHDDSVSTSSRCYGSTSCSPPFTRRGFPSDFVLFGFSWPSGVFLSFFWVGGLPLAAFSSPPWPVWPFFLLGGLVPLAAFSRCFPHGSWVGGGVVLFFLLLSLASCIFSLSLATRVT